MNYSLGPDNLVTECVLRNATYSVDFAVQDGIPSTVVSQLNINEELPAMGYLYDDDSAKSLEFQEVSNGGAHFSYQAGGLRPGRLWWNGWWNRRDSVHLIISAYERQLV